MPLTNRLTLKNSFPAGVLVKTVILLLLTIAATTVYDLYWRYTNVYITAAGDRIENSSTDGQRPTVMLIGASLEMLSTPRDWENDEFGWLRLIIQGSRIREFTPIIEDIIELKPDLVILGMSLLGSDPYAERLRAAFKRMLRAPLEATGVMRRTFRHDNDGCGSGVYTFDQALARVNTQFQSLDNELASSSMVKKLRQAGISVLILRSTLLQGIEEQSIPRKYWLERFRQDAGDIGVPFLEYDGELGEAYFCPDSFHMNGRGRLVFQQWLKIELLGRPEIRQ